MPVYSCHTHYEEYFPLWTRCRDAIEGSHRIKSKQTEYLGKKSLMTNEDYEEYLRKACYYNASGRTHAGMLGFILRKDPEIKFPDSMQAVFDDITLNSTSAYDFAKEVVAQVLAAGRHGALIDWNKDEVRPFVVPYKAEQIVNWDTARFNGKTMLSLLVLKECIPHPANEDPSIEIDSGETAMLPLIDIGGFDYFCPPTLDQYRVFRLIPSPTAGQPPFCTFEIWRPNEKATTGGDGKEPVEYFNVSREVLSRRNIPLEQIPFVFFGPVDSLPDLHKPPLLDVVDINISQFTSSANLEEGRDYLACPTPWVAGFPIGTELRIGAKVAWVSDQPDAKAEFLEFNGSGLGELREAIQEKNDQMAALGARMLEAQKADAEAAQTLQIRKSGESVVLAGIANSCGVSMTRVYQWLAYWIGTETDPETIKGVNCAYNSDFLINQLTAQQLTAFQSAYLTGVISFETLFYNLQNAEIIPESTTMEQERTRIADNPPTGGAPGLPPMPPPLDPNRPPPAPPGNQPPKKKIGAPAAA